MVNYVEQLNLTNKCFISCWPLYGWSEDNLVSSVSSVLFNLIFVFQGFCVPAEFEDEVAGEGATDFEDIEGGGLGQGEGVKDVSDQIENEDQVGLILLSKFMPK